MMCYKIMFRLRVINEVFGLSFGPALQDWLKLRTLISYVSD